MPHRLPHRSVLAGAVILSLGLPPGTALADDASERLARRLDAVVVSASPLRASAEDLATPVDVLAGETLDRNKSATLGQTLSNLTGVQSADFGTGVSRPILRGQDGPRVQVLSGGMATLDASTVSADHAISIEPFLADQIEVLKGPATLLFGSGAIGGAVNVVDGRIATDLPDRPLSGRAELRAGRGNEERSGLFRLDGVSGDWVLHLDGLVRNAGDVEIPGVARREPAAHDQPPGEDSSQVAGILPNSALQTRTAGFGATRLGASGYFGMAASSYRSNYGIPDGAHVHGDDHDHDHDHDHDNDDDVEHQDVRVRIDLVQNRWDLRGGLYEPLAFLQRVDLRLAASDYTHSELEGTQTATRFDRHGIDGRIEAIPRDIAGWRGAFGLQYASSHLRADGEEAFVPDTRSDTIGAFVLQTRDFDPLRVELGARQDRVQLTPDEAARRRFSLTNLSAAALWRTGESIELRMGLDRSERAPTQEELYAFGPHAATRSFEIGSDRLGTERALRAELGLHAHAPGADFKAALYRTRFSDFIHQADTGVIEHGAPVRLWTQQDAVFQGAEAETLIHLIDASAGQLDLRLFADIVRARLDGHGQREVAFSVPHGDHVHDHAVTLSNEGNLPRIAPRRIGTRLSWTGAQLSASLGAMRYAAQNRVAEREEPSPGYTLIDAHLSHRWDRPDAVWEVFLDASNLGNREARPHTSLLRDYAPLPGRALALGVRVQF